MGQTDDILDQHDGLGLGELVRRREISAAELLEIAIAKAQRLNPQLNFMARWHLDHARAIVEHDLPDGPFMGVPWLLKDLDIEIEGEITGQGSRYFASYRSVVTSELVRRYEKAGLVIFGKTTTAELGLTPTTEAKVSGKTRNPWNPDFMAGGSSGGSAAAVAARAVPGAHATDSGGSIRIPASCCGLFGFKPSRGRVPLGPHRTEHAGGLTVHHALTRTVRDSAALLDISEGIEPGSRYVAPRTARSFLQEAMMDPKPLRIALQTVTHDDALIDPECLAAAEEAANICNDLGHHIEIVSPPLNVSAMRDAIYPIVGASVALELSRHAAATGRPPSSDDLEPLTWMMYQSGMNASALDYVRADNLLQSEAVKMARFMERFDILLSPTLGSLPLELGVLGPEATDLDQYREAVFQLLPFTSLMNLTGQPSMSVPLAMSRSGLPIGVMCSARYGDDATLFNLAGQLERAAPWIDRRPPLVGDNFDA